MTVLEMNTDRDMIQLGELLGERARPGDLFFLCGDLGAGKTTLTKGIARGLGVDAVVDSPTFQILKSYQGRYPLNHLDLYRLQSTKELDVLEPEELAEEGITIVEWGDLLLERLKPLDYLEVYITRTSGSEKRSVALIAHGQDAGRLLEGIAHVHSGN